MRKQALMKNLFAFGLVPPFGGGYLGSMLMGLDLATTMNDEWKWRKISVRVGMGMVNYVNVACIMTDEGTHKCNCNKHLWVKW